jgi:alpha-methylacyl-CoA racemase
VITPAGTRTQPPSGGPLRGVRVVEIAGIGPGPFCAMVLSDLGAEVVRVDRADQVENPPPSAADALNRGRRSIAIDLKRPQGVQAVLRLIECAEVLTEGFRPGVAERLGIGPQQCHSRNPRLVYGRMTGWGQDGPYAHTPGHDINYIALSGALAAIGRTDDPPTIPLNLVGDFGGGGMLLAIGVLAALLEARSSGRGQVVDAAMSDGAALLMTLTYSLFAQRRWELARGVNMLDGGMPFYDVYETADGGYLSVGCLEPQFYRALLERLGLDDDPAEQMRVERWPALRARLAARFKTRTREEWERELSGSEVCFAPVLDMAEAPQHPHNRARGTFCELDGVVQPAPAPRFSRTPPASPAPVARPGEHTIEILGAWGLDETEIDELLRCEAVCQA